MATIRYIMRNFSRKTTHHLEQGILYNTPADNALSKTYINKMIVREPVNRTENLHPEAKKRMMRMT